jgi:hypothetical protein
MRVKNALPTESILATRNPSNLFLIQNAVGDVIIRAVRDNFGPQRKALFIRHLAAEGSLPDCFARFRLSRPEGCSIRWIIAPSLLEQLVTPKNETDRSERRLLPGILLLGISLIVFTVLRFLG